jgi:hypothetical protein
MSSSSSDEVPVVPVTQENRELNLVGRFDFFTVQDDPQRGATIMRFLGFGVVRIVGIDLDAARVGDIAVEIAHSGFHTTIRVWLKVTDGERAWAYTSELQERFYYTSYLA